MYGNSSWSILPTEAKLKYLSLRDQRQRDIQLAASTVALRKQQLLLALAQLNIPASAHPAPLVPEFDWLKLIRNINYAGQDTSIYHEPTKGWPGTYPASFSPHRLTCNFQASPQCNSSIIPESTTTAGSTLQKDHSTKRSVSETMSTSSSVSSDTNADEDTHGPPTKKAKHSSVKWMQSFRSLQRYKDTHGHCIVPRGYKHNPSLASWVAEQRYVTSDLFAVQEFPWAKAEDNWNTVV